MSFRYIGSKARVVRQLAKHIGEWKNGFFVDMFCGTGWVAGGAAELGWPIRLNDQLVCATTMAAARLVSVRRAQFKSVGGYENAILQLNQTPPIQGFVWREYSPASWGICSGTTRKPY
jgi:adenine-specific DNA-methyltransferase